MDQLPRFASYRDPDSAIRQIDDRIVREFSPAGADVFRAAHDQGVLHELVHEGLLIDYEIEDGEAFQVVSRRLPFVSYPAEWTSGMLKDAGLLTLEVARRLWAAGFHLRDASAYNIVFEGSRPCMVDLGSIGSGHTPLWVAYGQFCDHFLNPLIIEMKTGLPYRSLWTIEGVPVAAARKILGGWRSFGSGAFRNIVLRDHLESSFQDAGASTRRAARQDIGITSAQVDQLLARMRELLQSLQAGGHTHWSAYEGDNSYDDTAAISRDEMVGSFARKDPGGVAVDIGANTGRHACVLAKSQGLVVAIDSDPAAVEAARTRFSSEGIGHKVFPVVADIADPTPGRGFLNQERASLLERLRPMSSAIWMAVIHHLVLGRSVPLQGIATLAAELAPRHLIEFVQLDDPMAQLLSASRADQHHPYDLAHFEKSFGELFRLEQVGAAIETRPVFELTLR